MNERKDFDISEYLKDDVVYLENLRIENSRFASLQSEWAEKRLVITKCIFENVVFDNHCGRGYIKIRESEFNDCSFYDTFGTGKFDVEQNIFRECLFDGISIHGVEVSYIAKSKFISCNFKNLDIKWKTALYDLEIIGGTIKQSCIVRGSMRKIKVTDVQIEDVQLKGNFKQNRMESVVFKSVFLEGSMAESGSDEENIFLNCEMGGLSFKEGIVGVESLHV